MFCAKWNASHIIILSPTTIQESYSMRVTLTIRAESMKPMFQLHDHFLQTLTFTCSSKDRNMHWSDTCLCATSQLEELWRCNPSRSSNMLQWNNSDWKRQAICKLHVGTGWSAEWSDSLQCRKRTNAKRFFKSITFPILSIIILQIAITIPIGSNSLITSSKIAIRVLGEIATWQTCSECSVTVSSRKGPAILHWHGNRTLLRHMRPSALPFGRNFVLICARWPELAMAFRNLRPQGRSPLTPAARGIVGVFWKQTSMYGQFSSVFSLGPSNCLHHRFGILAPALQLGFGRLYEQIYRSIIQL